MLQPVRAGKFSSSADQDSHSTTVVCDKTDCNVASKALTPIPGIDGAVKPNQDVADGDLGQTDDDSVPLTGRWELYAWYLYGIGANGLPGFNYAPAALQNLLDRAAAAASDGVHDGQLEFAGRKYDVRSIVLLTNGIAFAAQTVLFLFIGAVADWGGGRRRRVVLFVSSLVAYGAGFGWLGVHDPKRWRAAVVLYIVGLVAYQLALTYWTAFPALARHSARLREARRAYRAGSLSRSELLRIDEQERSRLSNVSFIVQSVGEVALLACIVGVLARIGNVQGGARDAEEVTAWALSVVIVFSTAGWLIFAMPWFLLEKTRPGCRLPATRGGPAPDWWASLGGGLRALGRTAAQMRQLRQSLIYLVGYFMLGDSLNTTVTVVTTLQNQLVQYDALTLTYLPIVGVCAQALGIAGFWLIQHRGYLLSPASGGSRIGAKVMLNAIMMAIVGLDVWGMIGNWTQRFGFRNVWELWLYQALYGLLVCPWWSYGQIIISAVSPPGHDFLFSLFNLIGKASSFIGPLISSAIIDASAGGANASAPFCFLFALSALCAVGLWMFLDLEKSALEQDAFLARERAHLRRHQDYRSYEDKGTCNANQLDGQEQRKAL